jgi:hypothetical protein
VLERDGIKMRIDGVDPLSIAADLLVNFGTNCTVDPFLAFHETCTQFHVVRASQTTGQHLLIEWHCPPVLEMCRPRIPAEI